MKKNKILKSNSKNHINNDILKEIINPKELIEEGVNNSGIILCIIDIALNKKKYHYCVSPNTDNFWEVVVKNDIFENIFFKYKGSTLRKYWKIINSTKNINKFIKIIKNNRNLIDKTKLRILTIIKIISKNITKNEKYIVDIFNQKSKDISFGLDSPEKPELNDIFKNEFNFPQEMSSINNSKNNPNIFSGLFSNELIKMKNFFD